MFRRLLSFLVAVAVTSNSRLLWAAEPVQATLDALLVQQYFDTALLYLESLDGTPLLSSEQRDSLDYERATIYLAWAAAPGGLNESEERVEQATELLERFVSQHANHPQRAAAEDRLRDTLRIRAGIAIARAKLARDDEEKKKILDEAYKLYDKSHKAYVARTKTAIDEYKALKDQSADTRDAVRYKALREEIESVLFMSARSQYDWGLSLREFSAKDSPEWKTSNKLLEKAREEFLDFSTKFRTHLRGVWAIYYAGRCHQMLGQLEDALALYDELRQAEPNQPAMRELMTNATTAAMECWLEDAKKEFAKAVQQGELWADELTPAELQTSFGLDFQWTLAQAIEKALPDAKSQQKILWESRQRKLLSAVAATGNPRQADAAKWLAEASGKASDTSAADEVMPKSFTEAMTALREHREKLATNRFLLQVLAPKLEATQGERRAEIEGQLARAKEEAQGLHQLGQRLARAALSLTTQETPADEITEIRHFLALASYESGEYLDAAVLGEYVARYQPASPYARSMAMMAVSSYLELYKAATTEDREFETEQLITLCEYVAKTWPTETEGQEASLLLSQLLAQQGDLQAARAAIERIGGDASRRVSAQVMLGLRQWGEALRVSSSGGSSEERTKLRSEAQKTLEQALEGARSLEIDATLAKAALTLAEIYLDANNSKQAIALLEDAQIGPKVLADQNHSAMEEPGLIERVYRVALRAYIASLPSASNKSEQLAKTTAVMEALDRRVGSTPEGRAQLTAIYKSLALELNEQLKLAPPSERTGLAAGFESFLENVSTKTKDFSLLFWIAESFSEMGDQFDAEGEVLNPEARKFFEHARDGYERIVGMADRGELQLDPAAIVALRIRSASTARRLGDFEKAFAVFEELLRENNMMLNVQIEAAEALQAAGVRTKNAELLDHAISGRGTSTGSNRPLIWGWGQLSKICLAQMNRSEENRAKFAEPFYSARYNLVRCRYEQSKLLDGSDKIKYLDIVKRGIGSLVGSYPDLGGPEWFDKFDRLTKQVQKELGEPTTGIQGLIQ
jgi:tetratricopeptide (TPR) repeat protein